MKYGCVQFNPTIGQIQNNIEKLLSLLKKHEDALRSVDLLVFPELVLSGYNFKSRPEIEPFLEDVQNEQSPSLSFAKRVAEQYRCYTIIGFPEIQRIKDQACYYNSTALVSPQAKLLRIYQKHFLYDTDKTWAKQGEGFMYDDSLPKLGPISMAICMDINPKDFIAPFEKFEYANFIKSQLMKESAVNASKRQMSPVISLSMAWLLCDSDCLEVSQPDLMSVKYWMARLSPLIDMEKDCTLLIANRWGQERDVTFAGSSCILRIGHGKAVIYSLLNATEDNIAFAEFND
ncbi:N-amidase Nta1 [Schizosaccharomyces cryophilus OY26]|uniref:N-amidase Nta1 n=1 Tax=Schizosaccharomyces cryophilus (strain OY26 / ATCC MYA-4695 / CBS 11777 / NBRC 106824 / NRRL Y48691) TaxID=653667 RepID=S9X8W3_SCHCR|nr:N-amidase Nta1 [Schizosaccharomyces cryophilus OY26]EPY53637.1 N-amidase Nta1 [Schizosaccharomyces cryophilus OY26]